MVATIGPNKALSSLIFTVAHVACSMKSGGGRLVGVFLMGIINVAVYLRACLL